MEAPSLAGKQVLVLGMAKSGVAVAKRLKQMGATVTVNDRKPRQQVPEAAELEAIGIRVVCGGHPDDLVTPNVHLLVKNPGIPYDVGLIQKALQRGIPVVTEVEIAFMLARSPLIGITGSNGKTTTTTLVGEMLSEGQIPCVVAGNIGQPLVDVVVDLDDEVRVVAELSSFQLKGTKNFRPQIATLLNIAPAHLDYHHTFADYVQSKGQLFRNQTRDDVAVINGDCSECMKLLPNVPADVWLFSRQQEVIKGVDIRDGWICFHPSTGEGEQVIHTSEVALPGRHNLENALAAVAVAKAAGCPTDAIRGVLRRFQGVAHRLEFVRDVNGVRYYNDSKATNPNALKCALDAFSEPVVLIAGGLDRGIDFRELVPIFRKRLRALITYGQVKDILYERGVEAGLPIARRASDLEEAVHIGSEVARPGDIVLLSPACASWDQFKSFEERGDIFKQAVHRL